MRRQLERSDLQVFFDHDHPPSSSDWLARRCERRNEDFRRLDFAPFDLIFGHFPIDRYRASDGIERIALIRDPVDRAISHFAYFKYSLPLTNAVAVQRNPIIKAIKNDEVGLVEFVRRERLDGMIDRFLEDLPPSAFRLIGFVEHFRDFAADLSQLLATRIDPTVKERHGHPIEVTQAERSKLSSLLPHDIERYAQFRSESLRRTNG